MTRLGIKRIVFRGSLAFVTAALVCGTAVGYEEPGERFYMVIYGAQKEGGPPPCSHCFATFARITEQATARPAVELHHINWFSRRGHETGVEHGLFDDDGGPVNLQPGENRTTRDALRLCRRGAMRIVRFGPYEINLECYARALRQIDLLESRGPGPPPLYKSYDIGFREGQRIEALNCLHAISDIDRDGGPFRTLTQYGELGAKAVVAHLRRWIKQPATKQAEAWALIWSAIWQPDAPPALELVEGG
jgi:hypothetical protein